MVSFQIAKNEFGEKLFKPLVNLHVTPNANIIQKVGDILKKKKFGFGGAPSVNQHYHTHTHYPNPPEIYHPHQHGGHIHYESHNHESHGYPSAPGGYPSGPGGFPSGPGGSGSYPPYSSGPSGYPGGLGGYGGSGGYPSGPAGGGYGFSGPPHGYYRDGSSNNPEDSYSQPQSQYDYNPNDYNAGRNLNNDTVNNQGFIPYNYQDVYPQNQQLQSNGPPNAYADYQSYNQNNNEQQQAANAQPNTYPNQASSNGQQNAHSVSFPNSRRKRSTTPDESISEDNTISDRENSSVKVEKVRSSQWKPDNRRTNNIDRQFCMDKYQHEYKGYIYVSFY